RAVGLPQGDPLPRGRGGGREVEGAVHGDLDLDVREVHGRDRDGAGGRPVALPQLRVRRVLRRPGGEEERIADGGQLVHAGAGGAGGDVFHERGAGRRPVA